MGCGMSAAAAAQLPDHILNDRFIEAIVSHVTCKGSLREQSVRPGSKSGVKSVLRRPTGNLDLDALGMVAGGAGQAGSGDGNGAPPGGASTALAPGSPTTAPDRAVAWSPDGGSPVSSGSGSRPDGRDSPPATGSPDGGTPNGGSPTQSGRPDGSSPTLSGKPDGGGPKVVARSVSFIRGMVAQGMLGNGLKQVFRAFHALLLQLPRLKPGLAAWRGAMDQLGVKPGGTVPWLDVEARCFEVLHLDPQAVPLLQEIFAAAHRERQRRFLFSSPGLSLLRLVMLHVTVAVTDPDLAATQLPEEIMAAVRYMVAGLEFFMSTRHGELDHHEVAELLTAGHEYEGVRASDDGDGLLVAHMMHETLAAFKGETIPFKGYLAALLKVADELPDDVILAPESGKLQGLADPNSPAAEAAAAAAAGSTAAARARAPAAGSGRYALESEGSEDGGMLISAEGMAGLPVPRKVNRHAAKAVRRGSGAVDDDGGARRGPSTSPQQDRPAGLGSGSGSGDGGSDGRERCLSPSAIAVVALPGSVEEAAGGVVARGCSPGSMNVALPSAVPLRAPTRPVSCQ